MSAPFVPEEPRESKIEASLRTSSRKVRLALALMGGLLIYVISHSKPIAATVAVAIFAFGFVPKLSGNAGDSTRLP